MNRRRRREDVRAAEEEASHRAKVRAEDLPFVATDYYDIVKSNNNVVSSSCYMHPVCVCARERKQNV